MLEVYYVQNPKQYKQVLLRLEKENFEYIGYFGSFGLLGCDYIEDADNGCQWCEHEFCQAVEQHYQDKDILNHVYFKDEWDKEFPLIIVYDHSQLDNKFVTIPVNEAKDNTKYGVEYDYY